MGGHRKPLAASSTERGTATLSLMSMRPAKPQGNARCPAILCCLPPDADSRPSVHQAIVRDSLARWCAHARPLFKCILVNGSGPTPVAAMAIIVTNSPQLSNPSPPSFSHFALSPEVALVRLDGHYGDAAVIAQLILAGVYLVTRGRGYQRIASIPRSSACWRDRPTARVTAMNTGMVVELFEGGWLELGEGLLTSCA